MNDPPGFSLKTLGLEADDLTCPDGGKHFVSENLVRKAHEEGGGGVQCLKCGQIVTLRPKR